MSQVIFMSTNNGADFLKSYKSTVLYMFLSVAIYMNTVRGFFCKYYSLLTTTMLTWFSFALSVYIPVLKSWISKPFYQLWLPM